MPTAPVPAPEPVLQPAPTNRTPQSFPPVQERERGIVIKEATPAPETIDVLGTAVVEPEALKPKFGTVTTFDYSEGFEDCRAQVIALFQDPTPRKRAEFIEAFRNLKPSK